MIALAVAHNPVSITFLLLCLIGASTILGLLGRLQVASLILASTVLCRLGHLQLGFSLTWCPQYCASGPRAVSTCLLDGWVPSVNLVKMGARNLRQQSDQEYKLCLPLVAHVIAHLVSACAAAFVPDLLLGELMTPTEPCGLCSHYEWAARAPTCVDPSLTVNGWHTLSLPLLLYNGRGNALRRGVCSGPTLLFVVQHALQREQRYRNKYVNVRLA